MQFPTPTAKQKKLFKKVTPFLWCGAVFAAVLACAVLVWYQYLAGVSGNTERYLINDNYNGTLTLTEGVTVSQAFETILPLYEVGVYFERLAEGVEGTLAIQLQNLTTGEVLIDTVGNISTVYYDGYTPFSLASPILTYGSTDCYQLSITAYYTAGADQLAVKTYDDTVDHLFTFAVAGQAQAGSLSMMITFDRLGELPVRWYAILCGSFALCAAGLCYLCFFGKGKCARSKAALAFIAVFVVGLFYQFALPSYSVPDELSHYDTAYAITNDWFGLTPQTEGATLVKRSTDAQYTFVDYNTDAFTYRYIAQNFFKGADGSYEEESPVLLGSYALPYYISAIGLATGQLLGWGGIFTAFFARSLNLLFYAGMVALSVKLAPFGQRIFMAVALLPIALHVGGSFSYDSCLLSLSFVVLALGLRLAYGRGKLRWGEVAAFAVVCILLAPLKAAYFPLTFLAIFIPTKRFAKRWQGYLVRFGIPAASVFHFALRNYIMMLVQVRVNIDMDIAVEEINAGFTDVSAYTLSTLISYPGVALRMVVNTFFTNFTDYVISMLGGTLGYQDLAEVNINLLLVAAFGLLLVFAAIPHKGERTLRGWHRSTLVFSALCVLGILVVACFSWTLITYETLWGFQGRYLLPALAFVLFAAQPKGIATEKDGYNALVFAGVGLNFLVLLNVASITFLR